MDPSDLRVFEAVARQGSMNRAANELHTVQSNVTARIRALEDELEIPLFRRHAKGVSLTTAGERLLPFVGRITQLFREAEGAARDDGVPRGAISIGSLETTAALRLAPMLAAFTSRFPKVRLKLTTGTTGGLLEDVVEYRLDAAFVTGPINHPELRQISVFEEELVLVTARSVQSLQELSTLDELNMLVFRVGCSYRQRLEVILAENGLMAARPLEFGSLDAILGCVSAGIGVTLLPKALVAGAWREGSLAVHELPQERARVETLLIHREEAHIGSALAAFLAAATVRPVSAIAAE